MRAYTLFQQYIWLVNTIHRAGKITLEEINRRWINTYMSDGEPIARTTFNRHKSAIEDMFGIIIDCDRRDGFKYYISNREVLQEDSIQNWMLSTLSVNSLLSESRSIHDRILLEHVPSDGDILHLLIDAMKKGRMVHLVYHKYGSDHDSDMDVEPYFIKLFSRRWYVFVRNPRSNFIYPLGIDRILNAEMMQETFTYPADFSAEQFIKDYYGVVVSEGAQKHRVVIRAFGKEAYYLRDLPLHNSQKELEFNPDWTDFEYNLMITADFLTPLLSRGAGIKVMEPDWLADEVFYQHDDAARLYEE